MATATKTDKPGPVCFVQEFAAPRFLCLSCWPRGMHGSSDWGWWYTAAELAERWESEQRGDLVFACGKCAVVLYPPGAERPPAYRQWETGETCQCGAPLVEGEEWSAFWGYARTDPMCPRCRCEGCAEHGATWRVFDPEQRRWRLYCTNCIDPPFEVDVSAGLAADVTISVATVRARLDKGLAREVAATWGKRPNLLRIRGSVFDYREKWKWEANRLKGIEEFCAALAALPAQQW